MTYKLDIQRINIDCGQCLGGRVRTDFPRFLILYESFRSTDLKNKKKKSDPPLMLPIYCFLSKNRLFVGQFFHFFGAGQNDLFTLINKSLSFNYSSPTDISKKKFDFQIFFFSITTPFKISFYVKKYGKKRHLQVQCIFSPGW